MTAAETRRRYAAEPKQVTGSTDYFANMERDERIRISPWTKTVPSSTCIAARRTRDIDLNRP